MHPLSAARIKLSIFLVFCWLPGKKSSSLDPRPKEVLWLWTDQIEYICAIYVNFSPNVILYLKLIFYESAFSSRPKDKVVGLVQLECHPRDLLRGCFLRNITMNFHSGQSGPWTNVSARLHNDTKYFPFSLLPCCQRMGNSICGGNFKSP